MAQTHLSQVHEAGALIRNEPVQARSAARLTALLDAAAAVVDEVGYERLTTAMVADRAQASIGTVYRYFPDRIAVLQSLAVRNAERLTERVLAALRDERHDDWSSALGGAFDVLVDAFRTEPGFASLRYGDVLDLRPAPGSPAYAVLADRMAAVLVERFGLSSDADAIIALEGAVVAADALAARALARDSRGYTPFLAQIPRLSATLLSEYFGAPAR